MQTRTVCTGWGWEHSLSGRRWADPVGMGTGTTGKGALVPTQLSNACIREIEASIDVDICMDVYVKSVDMDMDIDDRYHVHGYVKVIHNNARSNSVGTVPCTEADNRR